MSTLRAFVGVQALACCAAATLLLAGCGDGRPTRVPVSGRVLIDGQPVTKGTITVIPDKDRSAQGDIGADGRFVLTTYDANDGCVVGKHKVIVVSRDVLSPTKIRWLVPQKYCEIGTSDAAVSIDGPTDSAEINLTWAGGKPFVEETMGTTQGDVDPTKLELK